MAKVCNSWAELEMALQQAMYDAIDEATQNSYDDLKENVEHFYDASEGTYHRTGQLKASPQLDAITHSGNTAVSQISINTGTQYDPAGRDTHTIYEYAEDGGLIGNGGFWEKTEEDVKQNVSDSFGKRFK